MTKRKEIDPRSYEWDLTKRKHDVGEDAREEWEETRRLQEYSPMVLGWRLRFERQKSGLTQEEAASSLGISASTLSDWEKGRHEISLRDAHNLMMLYNRLPGDRPDWDKANLNTLTMIPMG